MFSPTLPDMLREFRAGHPDVDLVLRELPTIAQLSALVAGELDVGVIRGPVELAELDGQLELMTIQRERLVAALPGRPPRSPRAGALRAEDLRGESFVILARREAPGLFAGLAAAMREAGGLPEDVLEVAEMQTIISLVAGRLRRLAGAGVGRPGRPQRRRLPPVRGADADDRAGRRLAARGRHAGARRVPRGRAPAARGPRDRRSLTARVVKCARPPGV